jgi:hypothetical protein
MPSTRKLQRFAERNRLVERTALAIGIALAVFAACCGWVIMVRPIVWTIGEHAPPELEGGASVKIETLRAEGKLWVAVWYHVKKAHPPTDGELLKVPIGLRMSNGDLVKPYGGHVPHGGPGFAQVLFLVEAEKARAGTMRFRYGDEETIDLNWLWRSFLH